MENKDPRELSIGHLLAHVSRLVGQRRRMKLQSVGLHHAQGMILSRLWREDGVPQNILAQDLYISPPTASGTLKRMERDGLIKRCRDETDQRIVKVYLTEVSRELQLTVHGFFSELDNEMASTLTEKEREDLKESLLKVHQCLAPKNESCLKTTPGQSTKVTDREVE